MMPESWEVRRDRYIKKTTEALEEAGIGLFGEKLSILVQLMKDGHHPWFDEHVLSITWLFIRGVSGLRYEPVDDQTRQALKRLMEVWPGRDQVQEYHVICDASNNPCTLVDKNCVCAGFGLKVAGMWAEFSLTIGGPRPAVPQVVTVDERQGGKT